MLLVSSELFGSSVDHSESVVPAVELASSQIFSRKVSPIQADSCTKWIVLPSKGNCIGRAKGNYQSQ